MLKNGTNLSIIFLGSKYGQYSEIIWKRAKISDMQNNPKYSIFLCAKAMITCHVSRRQPSNCWMNKKSQFVRKKKHTVK